MAASRPDRTVNGITYLDSHYEELATWYADPETVAIWSQQHMNGIDGYQNFIRLAAPRPGEAVLDVACGTGLAGLLACEQLGGSAPTVFFADSSLPMITLAKDVAKSRHTDMHDNHFQHVTDIRDPDLCAQLLRATGRVEGFDVILAYLFINHFTAQTRPALVRHLRTMLAPHGRLILQYGVPSPSHAFGGTPADEMVVGIREVTITSANWASINNWRMSTELPIVRFTTMISAGDRLIARELLRALVADAGGRLQNWREVYDRSDGDNISSSLTQRANDNKHPPGQMPMVQRDFERRVEVDERRHGSMTANVVVVGQSKAFLMLFGVLADIR